ncbi:MAG: flagellar hook-length control protein FliK [Oscillospiraceae bacterium]|nr:flagellar hook-length control protein FliK [Oscillospiraceae bacterium]
MQQMMDVMSLMTTRTEPGAGGRQARGRAGENTGQDFTQVFEQELGREDSNRRNAGRRPTDITEPISTEKQNLIDDDEDLDGIMQTAGVVANQTEIVFIIEGNTGTAIAYDQNVEEIIPQEQIVSSEEIPIQSQKADANEIPQDFKQKLNEEIQAQKPVQAEVKQVVETVNAETKTTYQAGPASVEQLNITETKPDTAPITAKDVEARMPETIDNQENNGNMSEFSENENPSPLDNENGSRNVETQRENTETSEPLQSTETVVPIAEGIKTHQFTGVQQMSEATLNAPVKPENLFQELVQRVELMQNETRSAMTITLNPEHLGSVALEVAIDAAGLHVKINAEDSGVRGMLNSQLTALIEQLQNKGIAVAGVEVAYTGMEYNHSSTSAGDSRGEQKKGSHSGGREQKVDAKDGVTYYTTLPDIMDYYMDAGLSSVEFSA